MDSLEDSISILRSTMSTFSDYTYFNCIVQILNMLSVHFTANFGTVSIRLFTFKKSQAGNVTIGMKCDFVEDFVVAKVFSG